MTTFTHLKALLKKEYNTRREEHIFYINNGYFPTWAEAHRQNLDQGLKQYSTPAKWEAYTDGKITREKAVDIAIKRAFKELEKSELTQLSKLHLAEIAPDLTYCNISVEWVRNSYWGNNPHATVTTNNFTSHGKASGCGYDKLSAAIASALNQDPAVLKMLYTAAEKAIEEGKAPQKNNTGCYTYRDTLGYGSGYSILPYFEGGVGVSCFQSIFEKCGYNFKVGASSRCFDSYSIYKEF
jgi:hypothetical protein